MQYFEDGYGYTHSFEENEPLAPYLTPQEVMGLLCIGKNTVYKLLGSGALKGFRIGKQWRITREAVIAYTKPELQR